jgi:hypothetical protein
MGTAILLGLLTAAVRLRGGEQSRAEATTTAG